MRDKGVVSHLGFCEFVLRQAEFLALSPGDEGCTVPGVLGERAIIVAFPKKLTRVRRESRHCPVFDTVLGHYCCLTLF